MLIFDTDLKDYADYNGYGIISILRLVVTLKKPETVKSSEIRVKKTIRANIFNRHTKIQQKLNIF